MFRQELSNRSRSFSPAHVKFLVCVLGLLVFAVDMAVPADLDVAIFYCFVIVLCAWTGSVVFLWAAATLCAVATIPGLLLSPPPAVSTLSWPDWANRLFGIGALLLVAAFIHFRMRSFQVLQSTMRARAAAEDALRNSEARLKLAQLAGHIGSWEWNPSEDSYTWSQECYDLFGIDPGESSFVATWMSKVDPADLLEIRKGLSNANEVGDMERDYRYEHPTRGPRWIHVRARLFAHTRAGSRWFGVCYDITDRKHLEHFLQQSQSALESLVEQRTLQLRRLSAELLQAQDEERRRIARELHDSLGQMLVSMKINLDLLAIGSSTGPPRENGHDLLANCLQTVQRCILETRTLSHLLHPPLLDEAGFPSAARWYVEGFSKRSKIETRLQIPADFPRLPPAVELALFRVLQESLTNVHRYSGASVVDVSIAIAAGETLLSVRDYGRGISPEILRNFREHGVGVGVGLSGMRERMKELGGTLEVFSESAGTTVRARASLAKAQLQQSNSKTVA